MGWYFSISTPWGKQTTRSGKAVNCGHTLMRCLADREHKIHKQHDDKGFFGALPPRDQCKLFLVLK